MNNDETRRLDLSSLAVRTHLFFVLVLEERAIQQVHRRWSFVRIRAETAPNELPRTDVLHQIQSGRQNL